MKLRPLKQWICDFCGEVIASPVDGWLEWLDDADHRAHEFKIVHHFPASPQRETRSNGCYHYSKHPDRADMHLDSFLGADGLAYLLSFIDIGYKEIPSHREGPRVRSTREWAELFRRLQLPYYEEARLYWDRAESDGFFGGCNQIWPYLEGNLAEIVKRYRPPKEG